MDGRDVRAHPSLLCLLPADVHETIHHSTPPSDKHRPPMSSPPDLLYLPEDVLREILAHLLVDTPRAPERTAVIQMCQLLHDLGIPLLYRVVDLTGSRLRLSGVMRTLRVVFGSGGLLARSRREGSFVREIRLGSVRSVWDWGDQDSDCQSALQSLDERLCCAS